VKKIDPRHIRDCADRIKRTRLALGFKTQKEFCEKAGIRYDLYTAFERAERRVSLPLALKIRDKLGIPLDWIYCGDDSRLPAALRRELEGRK
jgi:transcriptional regulator with XRE-family HTH domain